MRALVLAILMAVLLAIMVPSMAMASTATTDCLPRINNQTVSATMSVMAVGRTVDSFKIKIDHRTGQNLYYTTGTAYYSGQIVTATMQGQLWDVHYPITAIEQYDYITDSSGTIIKGNVTGTLTINSTFSNYQNYTVLTNEYDNAVITFNSKVFGNVSETLGSKASDVGTWATDQAQGSLKKLIKAKGDWTASVEYMTIPPGLNTFAGVATINGKLK
jgi:hypothetical protein